jgi:hypothetical protein
MSSSVLLASGGAFRRFTLTTNGDRSDRQGQANADTVTWMEPLRDAVEAVAAEEGFSGAERVDRVAVWMGCLHAW